MRGGGKDLNVAAALMRLLSPCEDIASCLSLRLNVDNSANPSAVVGKTTPPILLRRSNREILCPIHRSVIAMSGRA
jgi:hypothetical protein